MHLSRRLVGLAAATTLVVAGSGLAVSRNVRFSTFAPSRYDLVVWMVSIPSPGISTTMSPALTTYVSLPFPPVNTFTALLPVSTLSRLLPVPSIGAEPVIETALMNARLNRRHGSSIFNSDEINLPKRNRV